MKELLRSGVCRIAGYRFLAVGAVLAALLLGNAPGSRAGCGEPNKAGAGPVLSWLHHQGQGDVSQPTTIVGLWHLKYTAADGSAFAETFKTWHGDGTEFENAFLPPVGGNICFGVWRQTSHRNVKLHHIGLMFGADGKVSNIFTVDETDTVESDGKTYSGSFDFKLWPPSFDAVGVGNPVAEVTGSTLGTR